MAVEFENVRLDAEDDDLVEDEDFDEDADPDEDDDSNGEDDEEEETWQVANALTVP